MATPSDPLTPPDGVSDEEVDSLFAQPLDQFISSRDELAKKLRKQDRESSAWVKGLRKPSSAAWLTNQLILNQPKELKRLLEAADALVSAQHALAQGRGDVAQLRRLTDEERQVVSALVEKARTLDEEVSEPVLDRVRDTLHAVALDEEARRQVEAGRLTHELQATGFGPLLAPSRSTDEKTRAKAGRQPTKAEARKREKAEQQLAAARREGEERERLLAEARRSLRAARSDHDRAQKRLDEATSSERQAGQALDRAEARVREIEKRLRAIGGG